MYSKDSLETNTMQNQGSTGCIQYCFNEIVLHNSEKKIKYVIKNVLRDKYRYKYEYEDEKFRKKYVRKKKLFLAQKMIEYHLGSILRLQFLFNLY